MTPTSRPIVNPSPKTRLMANAMALEKHRNLMQSPDLRTSLDMTLLEYQSILVSRSTDANLAASNQFRLAGALEFIALMMHMGESAPQIQTPSGGKLNHDA